ncbi:MAG: UDP-N-acetylglucosamine--LPS N-acetylglucosamine transferase [Clostridia bacterium]|nr:UDP-N-acetylglucosamine--LPS N-acetylglucosamine transferase [Clostridia bacterium]
MSRVLILTASTGAGHNQAAQSLRLKYEHAGHQVRVMDIFKETYLAYDKVIGDGYEFVAAKLPEVYKAMYDVADMKSFNKLINRYGLPGVNTKIDKIIKRGCPDIIIATHPFAVGIVTALKRRREIDATFISIVTDFRAHFAYYSQLVDAYIVGSEYTKMSLVSKGIPAHKIYPYGIPINLAFLTEDALQEIDKTQFNVLVMAGSMGISKIAEIIGEVVKNKSYKVDIVCGKNKKLYDNICALYANVIDYERVVVHGFTKDIPQLMSEADVLISKPGGLTTTEALQKSVPMIIPFAIPGQEEENAEFLEAQGVAFRATTPEAVGHCVATLYKKRNIYNRMVRQMKEISKNYSIDSIVELSERLSIGDIETIPTNITRTAERLYI